MSSSLRLHTNEIVAILVQVTYLISDNGTTARGFSGAEAIATIERDIMEYLAMY